MGQTPPALSSPVGSEGWKTDGYERGAAKHGTPAPGPSPGRGWPQTAGAELEAGSVGVPEAGTGDPGERWEWRSVLCFRALGPGEERVKGGKCGQRGGERRSRTGGLGATVRGCQGPPEESEEPLKALKQTRPGVMGRSRRL